MLDYAVNHKTELSIESYFGAQDKSNRFFYQNDFNDVFLINDWTKAHEFVSLDAKGNVCGFLRYLIFNNKATNFEAINFSKDTVEFGKDLFIALDDCFSLFDLDAIQFSAKKTHPFMDKYKKIIQKHNGDIMEDGDYFLFNLEKNKYYGGKN